MGAGVGGVDEVVGKEEEEEDRGDGACHAVIELEAQLSFNKRVISIFS